ncbi:MAG TPA: adenylate/guanylate cyclase domain-containing protein [Candidatus Methylomirabilis sp.]|nr:adenylate/guanylate cyclase domain-containing protein [Candidatus Methylomirabilis sp.]
MQCPRCRTNNREEAQFCRECGARLEAVCPVCGAHLDPGTKFCDACGTSLQDPFTATKASSRFQSPGNYTPQHLAAKILTSRSALEGERKQVTVLFADVSGFTSLAARLDPEDVHQIMARTFDLMLAEVHRYEGTVNQFLGDGIMALFGAPIAHEDHAQRAVHAALGIRRAVEGYRDELRQERGIEFQVRQGLNTGLVVVGSIGSDLRMDYTAVGDTTNVAARLQQAADPGRVVIAESTHRFVEGYFHMRPLGELPLKGKAEPVSAWEVLAARSSRSRLEVEAERGLTPFVGRDQELRTLSDAFEEAKAGRGQVVALVGEAGIGKSRLLLEFRRRLGEEATWLEGHCLSFGHSIALHPLHDLLKRNFRIEEGDSEATILEKIERYVLRFGEDLRRRLPYFRLLLSVDPGDPSVTTMDPRKRRTEIFEAIRHLMLRVAEVRPQVIVCEDAHSLDPATEEYLAYIADILATSRILLVLVYRTGYRHPFGDGTSQRRIVLTALSAEEAMRMACATLQTDDLPEEVNELIARKADGNPFFVEEILRALVEDGALRWSDGRYVLTGRSPDITIPDTIQDLIMARIDRLEESAKQTLQYAAVIGREFSRRLLDHIPDLRGRTGGALARLKAVEFIYEKTPLPEPSYTFKHALTQEVAYSSLLVHRRKQLHHLIGAAIEEQYADRLAEQYEVLAYHFSRAEERAKAVEYLFKAADKAAQAFANREALALFQQVLGLLADDELTQRAQALKQLATVTNYLGDADASLHYAESGAELCEQLGDKRNAVALHLHITMLYSQQWDGAREDMGLKHLEAAAALVEDGPDSVEKALVHQRTGHLYLHRTQPTTTLEWAQRAVDMLARLGVSMGTSLGTALTYTGRIDEGIAYSEKNWEPVRKAAIPVVMAVMGHELCLTLALARDVPRATAWGERVLPEVVKASPTFEAMLRRPLLLAYTLAGEIEKAEETCQAIERIESRTLLGCIYEDAAAIGFYYLRRGQWDKASDYVERAIPRYRDRNNRAALSACRLVQGMLKLQQRDVDNAEDALLQTLEMVRSGGNVLVELWALTALCDLYVRTDRLAVATEHMRRGSALLEPQRQWYGAPVPLLVQRGVLATAKRQWDEAEQSFEEAVRASRQYHLPWEEARALYESGVMRAARDHHGDRENGAALQAAALEIFQRIGAQAYVEQVLAGKEVDKP